MHKAGLTSVEGVIAPIASFSLVTRKVGIVMKRSCKIGDLSMKERFFWEDADFVMLTSLRGWVSSRSGLQMQIGPLLSNDALLEEAIRFLGISPLSVLPLGGLGAFSSSLGVSVVLVDGRRSVGPRILERGSLVWKLT